MEVGVVEHIGVECADESCAHVEGVGEVVRAEDLHALKSPLHGLRRIAVHRHAVVVAVASHTGKGCDEASRVAVASCISACLLHAEHPGSRGDHLV